MAIESGVYPALIDRVEIGLVVNQHASRRGALAGDEMQCGSPLSSSKRIDVSAWPSKYSRISALFSLGGPVNRLHSFEFLVNQG